MKETIFFANFGNTWSDNEGSLTEEKVEKLKSWKVKKIKIKKF